VVKTRDAGFTLLEVVVVVALFGVFLWIIVVLTNDMRTWEKKMPVNLMSHPMVSAVVSRVRKDVEDAQEPRFPKQIPGTDWTRSDKVLLVTIFTDAGTYTVVWDFTKPNEVTRLTYIANQEQSRWTAHATPLFSVAYQPDIDADDPLAIEIRANDEKGKLAVDQVIFPRTHG